MFQNYELIQKGINFFFWSQFVLFSSNMNNLRYLYGRNEHPFMQGVWQVGLCAPRERVDILQFCIYPIMIYQIYILYYNYTSFQLHVHVELKSYQKHSTSP